MQSRIRHRFARAIAAELSALPAAQPVAWRTRSTDEIGPLPAHILEAAYREDKEKFPSLPYWKREFVGVGPYQLVDWEPGSHIDFAAFDNYFLGRPKLDAIRVQFIPDKNTMVANLLAGEVTH